MNVNDILDAIEEEFDSTVSALSPLNCHSYLHNIRQGVDVVAIEKITKKVKQPYKYLNLDTIIMLNKEKYA